MPFLYVFQNHFNFYEIYAKKTFNCQKPKPIFLTMTKEDV